MKYWLLCISLCAGFLIKATPEDSARVNVNPLQKSADSLMQYGVYYEAALLYQKAAYFSSGESSRARFLLNAAEAHKARAAFKAGALVLQGINFGEINDTLHYRVRYQAALCAYMDQDFTAAESYLQQLFYFVADSSLTLTARPLYSLVLNELERWAEARTNLLTYINNTDADSLQKKCWIKTIDSLYQPKNLPRLKNPQKAVWLSRFVPGLGQMYAGYWAEGVGSFLCNSATLALTAVGVYYGYYFSSILVGYTVFQRFYIGNTRRAEFLANKTNYKRKKAFNEKVRGAVLIFYPD